MQVYTEKKNMLSHLHKHLIGALEVYRSCKREKEERTPNSEKKIVKKIGSKE